MSALNKGSGYERSQVVADAFEAAMRVNRDGRARVTYKEGRLGKRQTVEVFLVGLGWNATYSGTQEALITRKPSANIILAMIPYPWLIAIEPVEPKP